MKEYSGYSLYRANGASNFQRPTASSPLLVGGGSFFRSFLLRFFLLLNLLKGENLLYCSCQEGSKNPTDQC